MQATHHKCDGERHHEGKCCGITDGAGATDGSFVLDFSADDV